MKHIVLPIMEEPFEEKILFRGLDLQTVRQDFFVILQTEKDDHDIEVIEDRIAGTYQVGLNPDWDDVLGNVQIAFLGHEYKCQVDCIVDAAGTQRAVSVISDIQKAFPMIGMTASLKIIYFADERSPYFQAEQVFYNTLKQAAIDAENGQPSLRFSCAYVMMAPSGEQETLRRRLLPFILENESMTAKPEFRTCGGLVRELDINSIEYVPKDLAVKTVCAMLCARPQDQPVSMFLMASGSVANTSQKEQLDSLRLWLEKTVPVRLPSSVDLLVQKGSPDGDMSTKELFERFADDNPYSDPALYDHADINELVKIPVIVNAVYEWENTVMNKACERGDLSPFIEQLRDGSEFDRLISGYQNPMAVSSDKMLTGRDGYSEKAVEKLESYTKYLQDSILNSVFCARLRLIRSRLAAMRCRMEKVQNERQRAVEEKRGAILSQNVSGLIDNWSRGISARLTDASGQIRLPREIDDVREWIETSAGMLLEKIPVPDYEAGKKELAESGEKIINGMRSGTDEKLVVNGLIGAVGVPLPERWIVYRQAASGRGYQETNDPVVIKLMEWYLHPEQMTQMDETLFKKKLSVVKPSGGTAGITLKEGSASDETNLGQLIRQDKEVLEIYSGTLNWVWKDPSSYSVARVDVFADTGAPEDRKEPVFSVDVHYKSGDRYHIGRAEELPSGVPLTFRITYLDRGKAVPSSIQEIRMRSPQTRLEVELLNVKEGRIFGKQPYNRLLIRSKGSFFTQHIAVGSSTGHIYTAQWERVDEGWLSELLPSFENWQVVDRPGDLVEYEIIQ